MVSKKKTMLHAALTAVIFMACLLTPGMGMCSDFFVAWTWMGGESAPDAPGIYGTYGVAEPANMPGSRNGSISWLDKDGNVWLFGGDGYGRHIEGLLNDLWRYDSAQEWTWMSGSGNVDRAGVYGTNGIAEPANVPGSRTASISWLDKDGDLWLFGGDGFDNSTDACVDSENAMACLLNDLWHYDTVTNQWAWESGSIMAGESGVYVDKGFPNEANVPGARKGSISWLDSNGYMWLFGGYGIDGSGQEGLLNDLWLYDKATDEWTWVSGSETKDQAGVYGIKGEANENNVPGARAGSISWIDSSDNLWLFGGYGTEGRLSDLWRYDPVEKNWTWVSGSDLHSQIGIYDSTGAPGCREDSISWIDSSGNLWLFGGFGLASTYSPIGGRLNDLWRYDPVEDTWTWVSGSNLMDQPGVYGTLGTPDDLNVPGARRGSTSWMDTDGTMWQFGGSGFDDGGFYGYLNDLWSFQIVECLSDENCDDGLFCTGSETCRDGVCVAGTYPCGGDTPACDEIDAMCVECIDDTYCGGPTPACDLIDNICVECADDSYCGGDTPACDLIDNICVECVFDSHCPVDDQCRDNVCVLRPVCGLEIKKNKVSSADLWKDKKITFKILTTSFGPVDLGRDITILSTKINTKNGKVKVKTIVPAGLRPQIIPVWVGACYGEIEITE